MKMEKMSIIEFCEEALDTKLTDWQKDFAMKMYEVKKNGNMCMYTFPRGHKSFGFHLDHIITLYCLIEKRTIDKEKFSNLVKEVDICECETES